MTWKYLSLVNGCIQILATIGIGYVSAYLGILEPQQFVPLVTKFVFWVALPSLVVRALGIGIDFWDERFSWSFIGAFLLLRALFLLLSAAWYQTRPEKGIGNVAVRWLSLTWISTVIVGIPISVAVFGNKQLGQFYGLVSACVALEIRALAQLLFVFWKNLNFSHTFDVLYTAVGNFFLHIPTACTTVLTRMPFDWKSQSTI